MPDHKVHSTLGVLVWVCFMAYYLSTHTFQLEPFILVASTSFFVAFLGSLMPDIDTNKSKIGRRLEMLVLVAAFAFSMGTFWRGTYLWLNALLSSVIVTIAIFVAFNLIRPRHRGFTHTIRANLIYAIAIFVWIFFTHSLGMATLFGVVAFFSYFSHLVLDGKITF